MHAIITQSCFETNHYDKPANCFGEFPGLVHKLFVISTTPDYIKVENRVKNIQPAAYD